ncbi:MAG: hypothetical protein QOF48_3099 [Verrucomicrobiota bacterium]|jgi:hypothetical protein
MPLEALELPFDLPLAAPARVVRRATGSLRDELAEFREFGEATRQLVTRVETGGSEALEIPTFVNEFWTARQRQASSLQEISYRACFKPQLPRFFIERLTARDEIVYDPFMGRGTTPIEAALLHRSPAGCDVNPLSAILTAPRLRPPTLDEIALRVGKLPLDNPADEPEDLLAFYHPEVLRAISSLKRYFVERQKEGLLDGVDEWLRMVAINRLTGHSNGFFSVYTLPPNQATSPKAQRKINEKRGQTPPLRDIRTILLKKSRQLLGDCTPEIRRRLSSVAGKAQWITASCESTPSLRTDSVSLVVTSPPFLDVVQYDADNWLRCWFVGLDVKSVAITMLRKLEDWREAMSAVFRELHRVVKPGGHVAFEVGEVRGGSVKLEETVVPCGVAAGFEPVLILINAQEFTKTANCWGVDNMAKGTNTNRIVLFKKAGGA